MDYHPYGHGYDQPVYPTEPSQPENLSDCSTDYTQSYPSHLFPSMERNFSGSSTFQSEPLPVWDHPESDYTQYDSYVVDREINYETGEYISDNSFYVQAGDDAAGEGSQFPGSHTQAIPIPGPSTTPRTRQPDSEKLVCLHLGCNSKSFKRKADLERHYSYVHAQDNDKDEFYCDYVRCSRHETPFGRADHLRDHFRDHHKEDLPRRSAKGLMDSGWWETRNPRAIFYGWWRCMKCLVVRVSIEDHGYTCPGCGNQCEAERQRQRAAMAAA